MSYVKHTFSEINHTLMPLLLQWQHTAVLRCCMFCTASVLHKHDQLLEAVKSEHLSAAVKQW